MGQREPDAETAMDKNTGTDNDIYNFKYNAGPHVSLLAW